MIRENLLEWLLEKVKAGDPGHYLSEMTHEERAYIWKVTYELWERREHLSEPEDWAYRQLWWTSYLLALEENSDLAMIRPPLILNASAGAFALWLTNRTKGQPVRTLWSPHQGEDKGYYRLTGIIVRHTPRGHLQQIEIQYGEMAEPSGQVLRTETAMVFEIETLDEERIKVCTSRVGFPVDMDRE